MECCNDKYFFEARERHVGNERLISQTKKTSEWNEAIGEPRCRKRRKLRLPMGNQQSVPCVSCVQCYPSMHLFYSGESNKTTTIVHNYYMQRHDLVHWITTTSLRFHYSIFQRSSPANHSFCSPINNGNVATFRWETGFTCRKSKPKPEAEQ